MAELFFLYHISDETRKSETFKLIGLFPTKEEAVMARRQLEPKPGFCDLPNNFHIREIAIGRLDWKSGFNLQDDKGEIFETPDED